MASPYAVLATQIAQKYGINPRIFAGLVSAESGWNPNAGSPAGARGLTQLMPATARGLGVTNILDPRQNLEGGAKYLAQQLHTFGGDYSKALAAYNAGPGAVRKYGGVPPYAETQAYVKKILSGSGGPSSADPGAVSAPAPGSPYPATLPGSIDATRLYGILNAQRQRVLAGEMPSPNYQRELQKLVAQALPRQQLVAEAHATGNAVGQVAGALQHGAYDEPAASRKIIGTPYSGTHTLGNWESDDAIDIAMPKGSPVYATEDGVIGSQFGSLGNSSSRFAGLRLHLKSPDNEWYYAHLSRFAPGIKPGARVRKGQLIGYSGEANGVGHLHLGVKKGNPLDILGLR